jgi:3-phosphoshikimate 1-carboxyvinyltransferase
MKQVVQPGNRRTSIRVPASKSDAQRAILCASLTTNTSEIVFPGWSDDVLHLTKALQHLGAVIDTTASDRYLVSGPKVWNAVEEVSVGESGLAFRLLSAALCRDDIQISLTGNGSLLHRNMQFLHMHFPEMGVLVDLTNENFPPVKLRGKLTSGNYIVDGSESSQYISGLLLTLPLLAGDSCLKVENLVSEPYVQMTLRTMHAFGVALKSENGKYVIKGGQSYQPTVYQVEGDWSAASYWLVASALGADIWIEGLDIGSLQADRQLLDILVQSGCIVQNKDGAIHLNGEGRTNVDADLTDAPDLFPALVTYAALTPGVSVLHGVSRLIHKESNRALSLQNEFAKLVVKIDFRGDVMNIHGRSELEGGINVFSHHDHRIAMCLAIAGMFCRNPLTIIGAESVSKSYPGFWDDVGKGLLENN